MKKKKSFAVGVGNMVGTRAVFFFKNYLIFFYRGEEILHNFDLRKYDFNLYKGFFFHRKKK